MIIIDISWFFLAKDGLQITFFRNDWICLTLNTININ